MIYPVHTDYGRYRKFGKEYKEGFHLGYDFDVKAGSTVRTITGGKVVFAGMMNGFGSLHPSTLGGVVIVEHRSIFSIYGHLDNILVKKSDIVQEKDLLGFVNSFTSNNILLPHLHFGIYTGETMPIKNLGYDKEIGKYVDPVKYLDYNGAKWPGV